jgi:hypothetical protein
MSQGVLIIACSLFMLVFGTIGTWLFIDIAAALGGVLSARRERKRLEAEAKALEEAEAGATEGEKV